MYKREPQDIVRVAGRRFLFSVDTRRCFRSIPVGLAKPDQGMALVESYTVNHYLNIPPAMYPRYTGRLGRSNVMGAQKLSHIKRNSDRCVLLKELWTKAQTLTWVVEFVQENSQCVLRTKMLSWRRRDGGSGKLHMDISNCFQGSHYPYIAPRTL